MYVRTEASLYTVHCIVSHHATNTVAGPTLCNHNTIWGQGLYNYSAVIQGGMLQLVEDRSQARLSCFYVSK